MAAIFLCPFAINSFVVPLWIFSNTTKSMKNCTVSKKQIADALGITLPTLRTWLKPYQKDLEQMGVTPTAKLLNPKATKFVCEKFDIDL